MKTTRLIWFLGTTLIFALSIYWIYSDVHPEAYIVLIGTLISYLKFFWPESENDDMLNDVDKTNMSQKSGRKSNNYQSKGDITINNK